MEQLFKNSKNIVYMLTSGFFLMACLCLFCLIIEMITAISAGKSPNILDPIFFGCAFSIFTWFFSFTGPLQLRFVQKLVQLNSDDFIYSTDKTIKKFRDGHTVTEYYAFVQIERWGKKIPIVYSIVPPTASTIEDLSNLNSYELFMHPFIAGTNNILYGHAKFDTEEQALYAIAKIKERVKENPQAYNAAHYDIVGTAEVSTTVSFI